MNESPTASPTLTTQQRPPATDAHIISLSKLMAAAGLSRSQVSRDEKDGHLALGAKRKRNLFWTRTQANLYLRRIDRGEHQFPL